MSRSFLTHTCCRKVRIQMNDTYRLKGKLLDIKMIVEIIDRMYSNEKSYIDFAEFAHEYHVERGGEPFTGGPLMVGRLYSYTETALKRLKERGRAVEIRSDYWRIYEKNVQVLGEGEGAVYLYYFPSERGYAESKGKTVWACKIGHTKHSVPKRVKEQLGTANSVTPHIALTLKTDAPETLEKQIHGILKVLGRHKPDAPKGTEWFVTNADEVITIYDFLFEFRWGLRRADFETLE